VNPIASLITQNPVFWRELRLRWPRKRFWLLPMLTWATVCAAFWALVLLVVVVIPHGPDLVEAVPIIGGFVTSGAAAVLTLVLGPALFAGMIATEREHQRLEMLVLTQLTPLEIIVGKWAANAAPLFLTIVPLGFAAAGFASFGIVARVEPSEEGLWLLLAAQAINVPLLALMVSCVGTFFSAVCATVRVATVWSFAASLGIYLLTKHGIYLLLLFGVHVEPDFDLNAAYFARLLIPWVIWVVISAAAIPGAHLMLAREAERRR
jgi:hypothetical protein